MSKKQMLISCFENAMECDMGYVALMLKLENDHIELIVIPNESLNYKLKYYEDKYNDELQLKSFNEIEIINFTCCDTLEQIELDFFY